MLIFFPIYSMVKIFHVLNFHPSRLDENILTANFCQATVNLMIWYDAVMLKYKMFHLERPYQCTFTLIIMLLTNSG